MDFTTYIFENKLVLIPVLYILGMIIKQSTVNDKYIPVILLIISLIFNVMDSGLKYDSVIQSILITGATVFAHQFIKQFVD